MTGIRPSPDNPIEWLNRANSSLLKAAGEAPGIYLEDLCFDAQQAAEKAIKAVFIYRGETFPYIHDIGQLLTLLKKNGQPVPERIESAVILTRFAVASRYPGVIEPVSKKEYEEALALARDVLNWASRIIQPQ
jgi:HEPN domain-containing protein